MQRFHRDFGFDEKIAAQIINRIHQLPKLNYTLHAKRETIEDKNAIVPIIKLSDVTYDNIREYTVEHGQVIKFIVRLQDRDPKTDFCYVIGMDGSVITVWATRKLSSQSVLRPTLYART